MKVPKGGSEKRSEIRKGYQKTNSYSDGKTLEEKKEFSEKKGEENEFSSSGIQPSTTTTALIPPWLRNTFGLSEKDVKPNQKCLKYNTTNDPSPNTETCETSTNSTTDCLKCHFYIQDTPDSNPILEVNIGSEADFMKDSAEKLPMQWRSKSSRRNQYECDLLGLNKERDLPKSVKSDVTSINVVVPTEDQEEDKRKLRLQKGKWKNNCSTNNENLKNDANGSFNSAERDFIEEFFRRESSLNGKNSDARLLLLCGKKEADNLTEKDMALLEEMKKQIGHKEGIEKVFSEIRESTLIDKGTEMMERKEEKDCKREDSISPLLNKNMESKATVKNKLIDEERKHEKKNKTQQKHMRCTDDTEKEKRLEKLKIFGQRTRDVHAEKEKKTKMRHGDYPAVEKVVTETLQKYIDLYRLQIPPDVVNNMKKNILQNLQTDYRETNTFKKTLDAALAVQDQFYKTDGITYAVHHLVTDDQCGYRTMKKVNFTPEESVVSKDIPAEEMIHKTRVEAEKVQTLNLLRKDFETCLVLIQNQLDITGTKLCSAILEKNGTEDTKLRIIHNFSNGVTESVKIYDRSNFGNPEGDSVRTVGYDGQNLQKMTRSQCSQTTDQIHEEVTTQTEFLDVSLKHFTNAHLIPGLYRITKATESDRLYLTPEIIDDYDPEEENKLKRVTSEVCMKSTYENLKNELLDYVSRETFISERINPDAGIRSLWRTFRSDCFGLNNSDAWTTVKNSTENEVDKKTDRQQDEEIMKYEMDTQLDKNRSYCILTERKKDEVEPKEMSSDREDYHRECFWLWNGKKMSPGIDLKVHVEDLLREKLAEILYDSRNGSAVEHTSDSSGKNLEIRKAEAKFCITKDKSSIRNSSPFIFRGSAEEEDSNWKTEQLSTFTAEESKKRKSVREVGTQNSQHKMLSLNMRKPKQRSKLCTMAKISKRRQSNYQRSRRENNCNSITEKVGEAKKVKLEFRKENNYGLFREKGSDGNSDSPRECFSVISNMSFTSDERPIQVKLIGIEVSKEKSTEDDDLSSTKRSGAKGFIIEEPPSGKEDVRKLKHWEIIENVLNRVNQKEKEFLWNDIRDFLKKKFGRDINDEGAKEVCIEFEQDVPKFTKGKGNRMVVARGNYTRKEGDVEVEVDLTMDDLERILRHRQKKLKSRRMHTTSQKIESKETSPSSSDSIIEHRNFICKPFLREEHILKERK